MRNDNSKIKHSEKFLLVIYGAFNRVGGVRTQLNTNLLTIDRQLENKVKLMIDPDCANYNYSFIYSY